MGTFDASEGYKTKASALNGIESVRERTRRSGNRPNRLAPSALSSSSRSTRNATALSLEKFVKFFCLDERAASDLDDRQFALLN